MAAKFSLLPSLGKFVEKGGFFFRSSSIYGGLTGFHDYGPVGVELKRNITQAWWKDEVQAEENVWGLDTSLLTHADAIETGTHRQGGADKQNMNMRTSIGSVDPLDQLIESVLEGKNSGKPAETIKINVKDAIRGTTAFLRPSALPGTFSEASNVVKTFGLKPPFGFAQVARSFRNVPEVDTKSTWPTWREFDVLELEYFSDKIPEETMQELVSRRLRWWHKYTNTPSNFTVDLAQSAGNSSSHDSSRIIYALPWGGSGEVETFSIVPPPSDVGGVEVKCVVRAAVGLPRATYAFLLDGLQPLENEGALNAETVRFHAALKPKKKVAE